MKKAAVIRVACLIILFSALNTPADTLRIPGIIDSPLEQFKGEFRSDRAVDLQMVYSQSEFASLSADQVQIDAIRFRLFDPPASFVATLNDMEIKMGVTSGAIDAIGLDFSQNASDPKEVLPLGSYTVSATSVDPYITVPLARPFDYDRRSGNLIMDLNIRRTSQNITLLGTFPGEGHTTFFSLVNLPEFVHGDTAQWGGIITELSIQSVPELSTTASLGFGALLIGLKIQRDGVRAKRIQIAND